MCSICSVDQFDAGPASQEIFIAAAAFLAA
jgi:hypothetical protein